MQTEYTARYLTYCWPMTPAERKAVDGNMVGFMLWVQRRWREFWAMKPAGTMRTLTDSVQAEFDAWLSGSINRNHQEDDR